MARSLTRERPVTRTAFPAGLLASLIQPNLPVWRASVSNGISVEGGWILDVSGFDVERFSPSC